MSKAGDVTKITLHDRGFPGDQLTAMLDNGRVGIHCITNGVCAVIDLTDAQARELAEWLMALPEVEA